MASASCFLKRRLDRARPAISIYTRVAGWGMGSGTIENDLANHSTGHSF